MSEVIQLADHRAVLVVEAALPGPVFLVSVPEVPLADNGSLIARLFQGLRQEPFARVQPVRGDGGNDRRLQTVVEGHPRRRAHRLRVELFEPRAGRGELIKVRCLDICRTVEADILPPQVVCNDVNDVGFLALPRRSIGGWVSCIN